jgi:hypothetical protein
MTRKANPQNGKWINCNANNPEEETIISNFKSYALHLHVDYRDLFFEMAIRELKEVGWPPTPQTKLAVFQGGQAPVDKCKCGLDATVFAENLQTKEDFKFCGVCFGQVPLRYDAKVWRIVKRLTT